MKTYFARNVRKAAQHVLAQAQTEYGNGRITLRLINGIHGGLMAEHTYRSVRSLFQHNPNVRAVVRYGRVQFETTW